MSLNSADNLIYETAIADGMPPAIATLMIGQARLETGNYSSHFFINGLNAFGYSYDQNSIWQIDPGGLADNQHPIAQYATLQDSVHEITHWIKRRQADGQFPIDLNLIKTPLDYVKHLREGKHPYGGTSTKNYMDGIISKLVSIGINPNNISGTIITGLSIGTLLTLVFF